MKPVLFHAFGEPVYAYPFFFVGAYFVALVFSLKRAPTFGISSSLVLRLFFQVLILSLIGARIAFALGAWKAFDGEKSFVGLMLGGGFSFYGGFLLCFFYMFWKLPREGVSIVRFFDLVSPGLALAHAMGRIGCFLNGCCFGRTCLLPWAVRANAAKGDPNYGLDLHPSQLYEALGLVIIAFLCVWLPRLQSSFATWRIYLGGYAVLRFAVEFSRGDPLRGEWGVLSTGQWIAIVLFVLSLFLFRGEKTKATPT